jgi:dedicator of cytokinesis protein 3
LVSRLRDGTQAELIFISNSGKGKAWESAIEICKDLAFQHAEVTFN